MSVLTVRVVRNVEREVVEFPLSDGSDVFGFPYIRSLLLFTSTEVVCLGLHSSDFGSVFFSHFLLTSPLVQSLHQIIGITNNENLRKKAMPCLTKKEKRKKKKKRRVLSQTTRMRCLLLSAKSQQTIGDDGAQTRSTFPRKTLSVPATVPS